jgi:GntR family transcriptional regulator
VRGGYILFYINTKNGDSIYQQIVNNFTTLILNNVLEVDEQLPSVRKLASDLLINPNTIQKAYQLLEERGLIYSVQGKGSFVADNLLLAKNNKIGVLKNEYKEVVLQLIQLQVEKSELIQLINTIDQTSVFFQK